MCKKELFGQTKDGQDVWCYTLSDDVIIVKILTYGGVVQSLLVPDNTGTLVDVVLGYDTVSDYEQDDKFLGAIVGRCANRIANGIFTLDGTEYTLPKNNGSNHLHGANAMDKCVWDSEIKEDSLVLTCTLPDGQYGYPGNLSAQVTYRIQDHGLVIDYQAKTDKTTLCNLTNHSYFNLSGHASGTVSEHLVQVNADSFTPLNENSIPLGTIVPVEHTPFDLRTPVKIGTRWQDSHEQIQLGKGFDHNFVLCGKTGTLRKIAEVSSEQTGICMDVMTTMPGVQLYTANYLDETTIGKANTVYPMRSALCLETQFFPDAIHQQAWEQPVLSPEETYHHQTIYQFSTLK